MPAQVGLFFFSTKNGWCYFYLWGRWLGFIRSSLRVCVCVWGGDVAALPGPREGRYGDVCNGTVIIPQRRGQLEGTGWAPFCPR